MVLGANVGDFDGVGSAFEDEAAGVVLVFPAPLLVVLLGYVDVILGDVDVDDDSDVAVVLVIAFLVDDEVADLREPRMEEEGTLCRPGDSLGTRSGLMVWSNPRLF